MKDYSFLKNNIVNVIGSKMNLGNIHKGVALGPQAIRNSGLERIITKNEWKYNDLGDISISDLIIDKSKQYNNSNDKVQVKNGYEIGKMNGILHNKVFEYSTKNEFVLVLGGDHSIASGSISALKKSYNNLKVIWIDAHADINTPLSSPTKNYHGMPVSHLLGMVEKNEIPGFDWLEPNLKSIDIVYIGIRDLDQCEVDHLKRNNIRYYNMYSIDKLGIGKVMNEINEYFSESVGSNKYPVHISFDIDGMDPSVIKQTGTLVRNGLTDREAKYIIRNVVETGNLVSLDIVELNPELGNENDKIFREHYLYEDPLIKGTQSTLFCLELVNESLRYKYLF